jgi:hypothetical protein
LFDALPPFLRRQRADAGRPLSRRPLRAAHLLSAADQIGSFAAFLFGFGACTLRRP